MRGSDTVTLEGMNAAEKLLVGIEAAWAARTVKLAPEPPGERTGTAAAPSAKLAALKAPPTPIRFAAVGDSLVAGCGVESQEDALTPMVAGEVARREGRPVEWSTYSQLGATMRRVRYRFMPQVPDEQDLLLVCAGSNDVMARRSVQEWKDDLSATLDMAQEKAKTVLLCSAGQPHNSPALPRRLRLALSGVIDRQTEASRQICEERGVYFADVANAALPEGFWAQDKFHPSYIGYQTATRLLTNALYEEEAASA